MVRPDNYAKPPAHELDEASFSVAQTGFAEALEQGIFAETYAHAKDYFSRAYCIYSGDTSRRTYLGPEKQLPVIDYIADMIDAEGRAAFAAGNMTAPRAGSIYRTAFDRYARLASYPGHTLSDDDQLARLFFPMRDLYRRGAKSARDAGDDETFGKWQKDWLRFSSGAEERMLPYDKEYDERREIYERFLLDKQDRNIWEEVAHQAEHEDERGEVPHTELQDIVTEELYELAKLLQVSTKDEQCSILARMATNGKRWSEVLIGFGDTPLATTTQQFLSKIVTPEELEAGKKTRLSHAAILGGRDAKAIKKLVLSKDYQVKGGYFRANPIAETVTVIEPSEVVRHTDATLLKDEPHVSFTDGLPTDMPFEAQSQDLIVSTRNTEGMDGRTLGDFYLELARVLKYGGVYVESNGTRDVEEKVFFRWKSLLAQMIVDTVEDRGVIPDRLAPDKEAAMLKGLGLTEQIFNYHNRTIRVLVNAGAVKEVGWYALEGMGGADRLFTIIVGGKLDERKFRPQRQTGPGTVVW